MRKDKLKIVFVVDFLDILGGLQSIVIQISNWLVDKGYDVTIISQRNKNIFTNVKAKVILLENKDVYLLTLRQSFEYIKLIQSFDICFINFCGYIGPQRNFTLLNYLYMPDTSIYECHYGKDFSICFGDDKRFAHYIFSNCYRIVSICDSMATNINKEYSLKENLQTIYNFVDMNHVHSKMNEALDESIDFKYILGIGRFAEQKNFPALIRAYNASKIREQGVKLLIMGDEYYFGYNERDIIKNLINELDLNDDVLLIGIKSNPFKYMKRAEFLVMSSKHEGFGLVLTECLATGTPVVAYDLQTGPNEIIIHEHNGLLVQDQNEDELAKAIKRLFTDRELYEKCKSNAVESIRKFDISIIMAQWESFIDEFVQNRDSINGLRTHNSSYVNPYGEFSAQELLDCIGNFLNYDLILEYFNTIQYNNNSADEFESNIYGIIDRYCFVFKCDKDAQTVIKVQTASNIVRAIKNSKLDEHTKNSLLFNIKQTNEIYARYNALSYVLSNKDINIELLSSKLSDTSIELERVSSALQNESAQLYGVRHDRWYKFGRMSRKRKIERIIKMLLSHVYSLLVSVFKK